MPEITMPTQAEHPMFADYTRISQLFTEAGKYNIFVLSLDIEKAREYYGILETIYGVLKPVANFSTDNGKDVIAILEQLNVETFDLASKLKDGVNPKIELEMVNKMNKAFQLLSMIKQDSGLGIRLRSFIGAKERLKRSAGVSNNDS